MDAKIKIFLNIRNFYLFFINFILKPESTKRSSLLRQDKKNPRHQERNRGCKTATTYSPTCAVPSA